MKQDTVALRKRTQITRANRTMFMWIAIASVLVGTALVVSFFLFQKLVYGEQVLAKKQETVDTLNHNLSVIDKLKTDVSALDANSLLLGARANDSDTALQVVLDALPSEANSFALGASLQNRLLGGIDGNFTLESLQVTPVSGIETAIGDANVVDASGEEDAAQTQINFAFSVKGDQPALKQVLKNLERSIRTIVVDKLLIETQADGLSMTVEGHAFYQPARTIELREEVVPHK